jgi:hypothetical protein
MEEIAKHFDGEDAVVGGAAATMHSKELAVEIGGLDTVDLNEKKEVTWCRRNYDGPPCFSQIELSFRIG